MTVRFYGQAPSKSDGPSRVAFRNGPRAEFLADLAGVTLNELHDLIEFRNLLERWPGAQARKGDAFPLKLAVPAAEEAIANWRNGDRVVFAGRAVARAFGFPFLRWFEWQRTSKAFGVDVEVALFPHPSSISLFWNEQEGRERAGAFMRSLVTAANATAVVT